MDIDSITFDEAASARFFLKRQGWHLASLPVLLAVCWSFAAPVLGNSSWLGVSDTTWFWLAIGLVVVHQFLVVLVFRGQLGWGILTRIFGSSDLFVWGLIFMPLLVARPVLILALGMADQESMALWQPLSLILTVVLAIPALYTLHSVRVYFGLVRAMGGDHFRREYREMPLVEQGAYQWSSNAMYAFVFLGLWAAAFLTRSVAALSVALFQHAFIWVHFYCTEEPDMALIYGQA